MVAAAKQALARRRAAVDGAEQYRRATRRAALAAITQMLADHSAWLADMTGSCAPMPPSAGSGLQHERRLRQAR